jgi:outer membrane immunogenic protein
MKRIIVALGLTATTTAIASAADLPARVYSKAPIVAQVYDWTGFYVGGNVGIGVSRDPASIVVATSTITGGTSSVVGDTGAIGGAQFGYNWQRGVFVLGAEADIQGSGLWNNRTCTLTCVEEETARYSQRLEWFGTARGRIGLATGPALGYVTAGLAYGRVKTENLVGFEPSTLFSWNQSRTGWTVGTGVEAALSGNWTGKIEYLYVDLGSNTGTLPLSDTVNVSSAIEYREHIFRAGINYRFGEQQLTPIAPVADWRGLYLGGNIGLALALNPGSFEAEVEGFSFASEKYNTSPRGLVGGGQLGYNWQAGSLVYGFETDLQALAAQGGGACLFVCELGVAAMNIDQRLNWLGTARGRIGYGTGPSLFYLTGGLAYGGVTTKSTEAFPFAPLVNSDVAHVRTGYAVGGGIETSLASFGLGPNWSAKTEYLYADLGTVTDRTSSTFQGIVVVDNALTTHVREHLFRAGLNYRFNGY